MARLNLRSRSPSNNSLYRGPTPADGSFQTQDSTPQATASPSPIRSFSSDKENQGRDAQRSKSASKSKTPMAPPCKRRRLGERATPVATQILSQIPRGPENEQQRFFNPKQNDDLRREIRSAMRKNMKQLHDRRDELMDDDSGQFVKLINEQNALMDEVRQTSDATIDSRFFVEASDFAYKLTTKRAFGHGSAGVDVNEFVSKCITFMRNGGPLRQSEDEPASTQVQPDRRFARGDDDEVEEADEGDALAWDVLGEKACFPSNRRPPLPAFLLGPLSVEKRIRNTQRQGRQRRDPIAAQTKPQEIQASDLERNETSNLTSICKSIREQLTQIIQDGSAAVESEASDDMSDAEARTLFKRYGLSMNFEVSLFQLAINPHSFGQSVENLFYISFLIRDGYFKLSLDDDGLPTLRPDQPGRVDDQHQPGVSRHQAIFTIDFSTWRNLLTAFDIEESLIPHRNDDTNTQVAARGWYG